MPDKFNMTFDEVVTRLRNGLPVTCTHDIFERAREHVGSAVIAKAQRDHHALMDSILNASTLRPEPRPITGGIHGDPL